MALINETLTAEDATSSEIDYIGGLGSFFAQGDFDDGTAALEFSVDGGSTWTAVNDTAGNSAELTANGHAEFRLGPCKLRVNLTGTGSSSATPNLKVKVAPHGYGQP